MLKTLQNSDVLHHALELLKTSKTTTSLDVKNELRNAGFFALQSDVSLELAHLVKNKLLCATDHQSGVYKEYSLPLTNTATPSSNPTTVSSSASNPVSVGFYGDFIDRDNSYNVVFDAADPKRNVIFKNDFSRHTARYYGGKELGIHLHNTRLRNLSNYKLLYSNLF